MTIREEALRQAEAKGISRESLEWQLETLRDGLPPVRLVRPCTPGDGIVRISSHRFDDLTTLHSEAQKKGRVTKFVPASGAATRMFRDLVAIKNADYDLSMEALEERAVNGDDQAEFALKFFRNIRRFAFYDSLKIAAERVGENLTELMREDRLREVLELLLDERGLNYGSLPKGLIPFHRYFKRPRTPFEEHLSEAMELTTDSGGTARIHYTVPSRFRELIERHLDEALDRIERDDIRVEITLSEQSESTDTIAVDLEGNPFEVGSAEFLFRPGGHGALLKNLNDLFADILLIKNIDNIIPEPYNDDSMMYWKILSGYLLSIQRRAYGYVRRIKEGGSSDELVTEALDFACDEIYCNRPGDWETRTLESKNEFVVDKLDRPLRVCGMVRNEGDPGGGPYWVEHPDGSVTPQIVETAQMDLDAKEQREIVESSTHFNPVVLVCGIKDHAGMNFDLLKYRDRNAAFVSRKSQNGKPLKALELPGLWNGSMAWWNTIFVEIPYRIFNPVKTVNDLLKGRHQLES